MLKLLSGSIVGFVAGAVYGVQFAVQIHDSKFIKIIRMIKVMWEVL